MSSPLVAAAVGPSWYRESRPPAALAGVVACRWVGSGGWDRLLRLVPDGCADLVWDGTALVVVGAHPVPAHLPVGADTRNVGLRLRPGAVAAVVGCRASTLTLTTTPAGGAACAVPLEALWGRAARRLSDALAAAPGPAAQLRLLEDVVADRLAAGPGPDGAVLEAARLLGDPDASVPPPAGPPAPNCVPQTDHAGLRNAVWRTRAGGSVEAAGQAVGLSVRELRRRFLDHVGYGPKALHRVLRFRRFLRQAPAIASGARSLALAAAEAGYADQSHLGRECRRLTGSSPTGLMARWAAWSGEPGRNVPDRGAWAPARSSPCPTRPRRHRPSGSG